MEQGNIKSFVENRGFGFITTANGEDLYIHARDLHRGDYEPMAGARVEFERGKGPDRRPRATLARLLPDDPRDEETGTVLRFFEDRGFGWIRADNKRARDIFLSASSLADVRVQSGDRVTFFVRDDPRGPRAVNVRLSGVFRAARLRPR